MVQVKQRLKGSFLSCSQDRSSCADPSRNRTLEVQIVRFMGKSFVIIVLEVLLQQPILWIPFLLVGVLSRQISCQTKGGTMRIVHKSADDLFPTASSCLLSPPSASSCILLSRSGQMLTASRFSYPSILVCWSSMRSSELLIGWKCGNASFRLSWRVGSCSPINTD